MPLYEYECVKCHRRTEKIENVDGPHLKKCPHCGSKVEVLLSAPAIQFKGSGWYITDYAGKKPSGDSAGAKDDKSSGDGKDSAAKDSAKDSTKDSTAKDKKPEKAAKKK